MPAPPMFFGSCLPPPPACFRFCFIRCSPQTLLQIYFDEIPRRDCVFPGAGAFWGRFSKRHVRIGGKARDLPSAFLITPLPCIVCAVHSFWGNYSGFFLAIAVFMRALSRFLCHHICKRISNFKTRWLSPFPNTFLCFFEALSSDSYLFVCLLRHRRLQQPRTMFLHSLFTALLVFNSFVTFRFFTHMLPSGFFSLAFSFYVSRFAPRCHIWYNALFKAMLRVF